MSIRIVINGNTVMTDSTEKSYKELRNSLSVIAKTANIDAKGPQDAAKFVAKTGELFAKKPATDVIEIFETPETKDAKESLLAKGSVKKLGQRVLDALKAEARSMDYVRKDETSKNVDTGNAEKVTEFTY